MCQGEKIDFFKVKIQLVLPLKEKKLYLWLYFDKWFGFIGCSFYIQEAYYLFLASGASTSFPKPSEVSDACYSWWKFFVVYGCERFWGYLMFNSFKISSFLVFARSGSVDSCLPDNIGVIPSG